MGQEAEKQGGPRSPHTTPRGTDTGALPASPGTARDPGQYSPGCAAGPAPEAGGPATVLGLPKCWGHPLLRSYAFTCTAGNTITFFNLFIKTANEIPTILLSPRPPPGSGGGGRAGPRAQQTIGVGSRDRAAWLAQDSPGPGRQGDARKERQKETRQKPRKDRH